MKHIQSEVEFGQSQFRDIKEFEAWKKHAIEKMVLNMSRYIIDNNLVDINMIGDDYINGDKLRPIFKKIMRLDFFVLSEKERNDIVQEIKTIRMLLPGYEDQRIDSLLKHFNDRQ